MQATTNVRIEEDALGNVEVPADHLWGAQTQRSHENFPIGVDRYRWNRPVIRALGILKKCAALANEELGQLPREKVGLIVRAAQEVIDGMLLLLLWSIAFFYHLCNGIRHLAWDAGHGFELRTAARSGYAVVAATVLLTVLAWLYVLVA